MIIYRFLTYTIMANLIFSRQLSIGVLTLSLCKKQQKIVALVVTWFFLWLIYTIISIANISDHIKPCDFNLLLIMISQILSTSYKSGFAGSGLFNQQHRFLFSIIYGPSVQNILLILIYKSLVLTIGFKENMRKKI